MRLLKDLIEIMGLLFSKKYIISKMLLTFEKNHFFL